MMARNSARVGPRLPQVVVLVGATGDLARRKLLPGLFHLAKAGFLPDCRVIGVSLDEIDADTFRDRARQAIDQFASRKTTEADWSAFAAKMDYVPLAAGADALRETVQAAERSLGTESRRIHYLSVPPHAAMPAVRLLAAAGLTAGSRIIMEKPFGTDLTWACLLGMR